MGTFLERLLASSTGDLDEDRSVLRPRPVSVFEPDPGSAAQPVPEAPSPISSPSDRLDAPEPPAEKRTVSEQRTAPNPVDVDRPSPEPDDPRRSPPAAAEESAVSSPSRPERRAEPPADSSDPGPAPFVPTVEPPSPRPIVAPARLPSDVTQAADVRNSPGDGDQARTDPRDPFLRPDSDRRSKEDPLLRERLIAGELSVRPVPGADGASPVPFPLVDPPDARAGDGPADSERTASRPSVPEPATGDPTDGLLGESLRHRPVLHDDMGLLVPEGPLPPPPAQEISQTAEVRRQSPDAGPATDTAETVHVRIGTVEVRASTPEPASETATRKRPRVSPTVMTLDEYLKTRIRGGDR